MSATSSWKKYGGINKLDKMNYLNVNSIVTDTLTLRDAYSGAFDICGNVTISEKLFVSGKATINNSIYIKDNVDISKNVIVDGNVLIKGNTVFNSTQSTFFNKLYFGSSNQQYLYGNPNGIGVNIEAPNATLDIYGNRVEVLNVFSDLSSNRNIIARNMNNRGIAVYVDNSNSSIDFYNDVSTNPINSYDGRIQYKKGGILMVDVSDNFYIASKLSVSNRDASAHVLGETAVIYDICNNTYAYDIYDVASANTGNSLSLISSDISSNTFLNIITPNKNGLSIGGGAYPLDRKKAMGSIGLYDASGVYVPTQNIVRGNNLIKYKTTLGINTHAPRINNYVVDINGPIHLTNGELSNVSTNNFEIKNIVFSTTNKDYGLAFGTPYTTSSNNYRQKILYTNNGGKSWSESRIVDNFDQVSHATDLEIQEIIFRSGFIYYNQNQNQNYSIIGGDRNYIFYSNDGGKKWNNMIIANPALIDFGAFSVLGVYIGESGNQNTDYKRVVLVYDFGRFRVFDVQLTLLNSNMTSNNTYNIANSNVTNEIGGAGVSFNNIHGYGDYVYMVGSKIIKYNIITKQFVNEAFHNLPNSSTMEYNYVYAFNNNYVIVVGEKIISYTKNGGSAWTDIYVNTSDLAIDSIILQSVHILDENYAIAVGNNGIIVYSIDGALTWKTLANDMINSSGNGNRLVNTNYNLNGIIMQDINSFAISTLIRQYSQNQDTGKTNIMYCFLPNLMNRTNNYVFDMSGNMGIDGDIRINSGKIMIKDELQSTSTSTGALQISGGAGIAKNTYIGGNLVVNASTQSGSISAALFVPNGGATIGGNLSVLGNLNTFQNMNITGDVTYDSVLTINNTSGLLTTNRNPSNLAEHPEGGAIIIKNNGGLYVTGNTYIGGQWLDIAGELVIAGNIIANKNITVLGNFIPDTISIIGVTPATGLDEGAFKVTQGGASIKGNTYIGGNLILSTTDSNVVIGGTIGVTGVSTFSNSVGITGIITAFNSTDSTSFTNGAIVVSGGVGVAKNLNVNGIATMQNTTESTSISSGSLIVKGGLGIAKNNYVGGNSFIAGTANITGNCNITANTNATGNIIISNFNNNALNITNGGAIISGIFPTTIPNTGALRIPNGGAYIGGNLLLGGNININSGTTSTSVSTGAFTVNGGIGISGNSNVGGSSNITGVCNITGNCNVTGITTCGNTTASTTTSNGALIVNGGVGIAGNINIGSAVGSLATIECVTRITNATDSNLTTNGALVVSGGVGIGNKTNIGGITTISSGTASTTTVTGALVISGTGGVGIGGNTNIGGITKISSGTASTGTDNGALVITGSGGVGIGGNINIGGSTNITGITTISNATASSATGNGALVVSGGVGIGGATNIGGITTISSGTASVETGSGALVISGTGGAGIGGNINIGGRANITGASTISGITTISNATASSATGNGALVVSGGVGIGGATNIGGITTITNGTASTTTGNGAFVVTGGVGIGGATNIAGITTITNGTASSATANGALVVSGGVGITGATNIAGITTITNGTASSAVTNGALVVNGGIGIAKSTTIGGITTITSGTPSTTSGTGSLVVTGGVGVGGNIYVGANANITGTATVSGIATFSSGTASTGTTSGAVVISGTGGMGVGGAVNIGGITTLSSGTASTGTGSGSLVVSGGAGISGNIYVGTNANITGTATVSGITTISNGTGSAGTGSGALVVSGGVGIAGATNIGGVTTLSSGTASSGTGSGALVVSGGVGVSGNIYVGTNANITGTAIVSGITTITNTTTSTGTSSGALVVSGGVGVNGTINAVTFNATSDYRIKENVKRLDDNFSVDKLEPVFYHNALSKRDDIGFIAHKVQELYPYLVNGEKDSMDYQTLNYTGLIGILVHEIQELKKKVAELELR